MGLFGRKAQAPPPPPPPAARPSPPANDDPLAALVGLTVGESAFEDGTLTLTFRGPAGEAHLEAYGLLVLNQAPSHQHERGSPGFKAALKTAPGQAVTATKVFFGDKLTIEFEKGLTLVVSLQAGSYPGECALYLKGPGKSYVNYNENGVARLTL